MTQCRTFKCFTYKKNLHLIRQIVAVQYADGGVGGGGGKGGGAKSQLSSNKVLTKALGHQQGPNKGGGGF